MGDKRLKLARGLGDFVPTSVNFTDIAKDMDENEMVFEPSDDGLEVERVQNNLQYEEMVVQILYNLESREKLIFVFQLLRDNGFQIDHGSFAKVLKLSRRQYMRVLEDVRMKSALYVVGYTSSSKSHKDKQ